MPKRIKTHHPKNLPGRKENRKRYDKERASREPWRTWYHTSEWKRLRQAALTADPFCVRCLAKDLVVPATVANHKKPHRGNRDLFFNIDNLEGVCKPCHDSDIQSEEKRSK